MKDRDQRSRVGRPDLARSAQITDLILRSTVRAFAQHGGNFSIDHVMDATGVSRRALYRRWPGKIELLVEAIDSAFDRWLGDATSALPSEPKAALKAVLRRLFLVDLPFRLRFVTFLRAEALRNSRLTDNMARWQQREVAFLEPFVRAAAGDRTDRTWSSRDLAEMAENLFQAPSFAALSETEDAHAADSAFEQRWRMFLYLVDRRQEATS